MTANHLLRELAPVSDAGWQLLDGEARQRLTVALGARKLVDFSGPHGWGYSATNLGRIRQLPLDDGLDVAQRQVLPLVEVRAEFTVSRRELEAYDRGAAYTDLDGLDEAALRMASAENVAVLHGWPEAGIQGVTQATPHDPVPRVEEFVDYPKRVAKAVTVLLQAGISGPFGLALGPGPYNAVMESAERGGYLLQEHLARILHGPIVFAPGVRGAIVMSLRGGDFLFESGQDLAIGYSRHDADKVYLYLEQSFSFQVATPEAAVHLRSSSEQ